LPPFSICFWPSTSSAFSLPSLSLANQQMRHTQSTPAGCVHGPLSLSLLPPRPVRESFFFGLAALLSLSGRDVCILHSELDGCTGGTCVCYCNCDCSEVLISPGVAHPFDPSLPHIYFSHTSPPLKTTSASA
jgi:hypothetical protein